MRPAGMLPHCRSDCDTFCDYQCYRVHRDCYGPRIECRGRIMAEGCSIELAAFARHCDGLCVLVCRTRQRRDVRDVYVGVMSGGIATCPFRKSRREHASFAARLPVWMSYVCTVENCWCSIRTRQVQVAGTNVAGCNSRCP